MTQSSEQKGCAWLCRTRLENNYDKSAPWLQHFAVWAKDVEQAKALLLGITPGRGLGQTITDVITITAANRIDDPVQQTLASNVGPFISIVFGEREPLTQQRLDDYSNTDYLSISEHSIPALITQPDIPSWNKEWITPKLKTLLFEQPRSATESDTSPEQALNTFLVADAKLCQKNTQFFDLDSGIDIPIRCLFSGKAAEELTGTIPYLIDMTLPKGAWDNKDKVPRFHKDFFEHHWYQGTGIIINTTASMDTLYQHLKKFTHYKNTQDKEFLFRFWDSNSSYDYFSQVSKMPTRAKRFFNINPNHWIISIASYNKKMHYFCTIAPKYQALEDINPPQQAFINLSLA